MKEYDAVQRALEAERVVCSVPWQCRGSGLRQVEAEEEYVPTTTDGVELAS